MKTNPLIAKLKRAEPAIGTWLMFRDPAAVEMLADAGFDWLCIDSEHCAYSSESLQRSLQCLRGSDTAAIVRVPDNAQPPIKLALDLGADGVMVPMVCSPDDARRAVAAAKYPPLGRRGYGPVRASRYLRNTQHYLASANQQTLLIAQIEHIQAVRNIQAILAVQGLDAIYVGPGDLSLSMGHPPSGDHPDVIQAIEQVFAAAKAASLPCGTLTTRHDELAFWLQRGGTLMTIGGDLWFLRDAADAALTAARQALAARA